MNKAVYLVFLRQSQCSVPSSEFLSQKQKIKMTNRIDQHRIWQIHRISIEVFFSASQLINSTVQCLGKMVFESYSELSNSNAFRWWPSRPTNPIAPVFHELKGSLKIINFLTNWTFKPCPNSSPISLAGKLKTYLAAELNNSPKSENREQNL